MQLYNTPAVGQLANVKADGVCCHVLVHLYSQTCRFHVLRSGATFSDILSWLS